MVMLRICIAALFLLLLSLNQVSFNISKPTGFSLKLIPSFSPDSPLYPGKQTQHEKIQRMVELSKARAKHVDQISNSNPENIYLKMYQNSIFYSVQVFMGTPARPQTLLMDTGSSLIWTQCTPCINCFNQSQPPIFAPNTSTTYRRLPCADPICRQFYQCVDGQCVYDQRYGGGAKTKGFVSLETFTFPSNGNRTVPVRNVVLGCANDNTGFNFGETGRISGILGLGPHPNSLTSQLKTLIDNRFSYCLPSGGSDRRPMAQIGVLRFGGDVQSIPDLKTTPFLRGSGSSHYYLNLLDVSVGRRRLELPPGTFELKRNGTGGVIIDSGCAVTNMDGVPFRAVMAAFRSHFLRFGFERVGGNVSEGLELCYKQRKGFRGYYAGLTFHFEGADMAVDPRFVYVENNRRGYFCIALLATTGRTLIGAWQQRNTRFIYDLNLQRLLFAPEDNCSRDRLFS